jgi:hypothetical protein
MIGRVGGVGGAGGIFGSNSPQPPKELVSFNNDFMKYIKALNDLESNPSSKVYQQKVDDAQNALIAISYTGSKGSMLNLIDKFGFNQMFGSGVGQTFYDDMQKGLPGYMLWPGGPQDYEKFGEALQNNPDFLPRIQTELSDFYHYFSATPPTPE